MSNDITPSRLTPAAVPSAPAVKLVEEVRAKVAEAAKPTVQTIPGLDLQESRRNLEETSKNLNEQMRRNGRDLSFSVDDVANKVVLTVKNKEGEVVRQIPNEVVLRVAHNIENVKGMLQDDES